MKRTILAALLACAALTAHAAGECDKYTTSYDRTYCYVKLFTESDKELNDVYKQLRDQIKDPLRKQLTETQRAWMRYRDATCQSEPGTINVDCNYDVNRQRSDYLRDRVRECKAGTCRPDMIAAQSWN